MIVAVLDTNVLASAVAGLSQSESTPGELLRRWRANAFTLVVTEPILVELVRTLTNPYFAARLSRAEVESALAWLRVRASLQAITALVSGVATHPEDDAILATALSARADYLVTDDKRLLERVAYRGTSLLTHASSSMSWTTEARSHVRS